jgi:hypothetical protein
VCGFSGTIASYSGEMSGTRVHSSARCCKELKKFLEDFLDRV